MGMQPKQKMSVTEYLSAYEGSTAGRYELVDGEVIMMSPETALHNRVKQLCFAALRKAIAETRLDCEVFGDGMAVKIDEYTAREPDASVQCGKTLPDESLLLDRPMIVLEVVSPSSQRDDTGRKMVEYSSVASIQHYVVVDPWRRVVVHHRREAQDRFQTVIMGSGILDLSPPGLSVPVHQLLSSR